METLSAVVAQQPQSRSAPVGPGFTRAKPRGHSHMLKVISNSKDSRPHRFSDRKEALDESASGALPARLDLVARLKSSYPEIVNAPTPDLIRHRTTSPAYMKTPHDVGCNRMRDQYENKQYRSGKN